MSKVENKFYTCKEDLTFKYVMLDERNKDILSTLLETVLKRKINKIVLLSTEELEENKKIKNKRVDAYIETNEGNINIEVNANNENYVHPRNMAFISDVYAHQTLVRENYTEEIEIMPLNFTYGLKDDKPYRIYFIQDEEGKAFVKNFKIYEINMDRVMKFRYDKGKEKIEEFKHLIMLNLNEEELNILSKEDKVVRKYMDKLLNVNLNSSFQTYMSKEEDERKIRNTGLDEAREEGSNRRNVEIAKSMLEKDIDINIISEITELSIEEIKSLK